MSQTISSNNVVYSDLGNAGLTKTINFWSDGNRVLLTLDQVSCTLTFSNHQPGIVYELRLKQGTNALGGNLVVWPVVNFSWGTDGSPTLSTADGVIDIIQLRSDGTNLFATLVGKGFSD